MRLILPMIMSLVQHCLKFSRNAQQYRPDSCPRCGATGLWGHGSYARKADRENSGEQSLNPILIPRFYCPKCHATCSVLPECIPPNRHYLWSIQQSVFILSFLGESYWKISQQVKPSRWTISRWCKRLKAQFSNHSMVLKVLIPDLGRFTEYIHFWPAAFKQWPLSRAMLIVNNAGLLIP